MTRPRWIYVRAAALIGFCLVAAQCNNNNSLTGPSAFLSGLWTGTLESISGPATAPCHDYADRVLVHWHLVR